MLTFRKILLSPEGKSPFGRPESEWEDIIKADVQEIGWGLALDLYGSGEGQVTGFYESCDEPPGSNK